MWDVATVWSVCLCVCVLVTTLNPAKAAETFDMSFGMWTRAGPRKNYVLDGDARGSTQQIQLNDQKCWQSDARVVGTISNMLMFNLNVVQLYY